MNYFSFNQAAGGMVALFSSVIVDSPSFVSADGWGGMTLIVFLTPEMTQQPDESPFQMLP